MLKSGHFLCLKVQKNGQLKNLSRLSSQSKKTTHDKFEKVIATHLHHELCA